MNSKWMRSEIAAECILTITGRVYSTVQIPAPIARNIPRDPLDDLPGNGTVTNDGGQQLGKLYAEELLVAQSAAYSDQQREAFAKRWLGVVRSELQRQLCYLEEPAKGQAQAWRVRLQAAFAPLDYTSSGAQMLAKRIAELNQREQGMLVGAQSLHEKLKATDQLLSALDGGGWRMALADPTSAASTG